nr:type II secretion system F family protein [Clostridium cuniculi]
MGKLYDEGISLLNILNLIDELPLKKEYKGLLKEMEGCIREGGSLCEGFKRGGELIPSFFNSMIDIGERTGKIVYVLRGLETFYSKLYYVKKAIIGALTYPAVLLGALALLGVFVLFFFIPNMSNIYSAMGHDIPEAYVNIILFKERFFDNPIIVIIQLTIIFVILPYFVIKNFFRQYLDLLIEKIPIYNLINEYIAIVLMSVVINSGINIAIGLQYCCESELGKTINRNIKKINNDITAGRMLSQSMSETEMFSKYTLAHIKLGEESGSLDKRLQLLEEEVFKNLTTRINKITQLIQPFLILFIGVIIVSFIIKFLMPLLDIVLI